MDNKKLEDLRGIYLNETLDEPGLARDPLQLFQKWLDDAVAVECIEPNAFVLSTVAAGRPRSRVVLLKGIDDSKLVFYSNYQSAKGHEMDDDQDVAMNFWWGPLGRQVRIEGVVEKVSAQISDAYFSKRPRGSQLGAIASAQSSVTTRQELEEIFAQTALQYEKMEEIPRPPHWGGYAIEPKYIEFWQGRANRLHDRISFERVKGSWEIKRLAP